MLSNSPAAISGADPLPHVGKAGQMNGSERSTPATGTRGRWATITEEQLALDRIAISKQQMSLYFFRMESNVNGREFEASNICCLQNKSI